MAAAEKQYTVADLKGLKIWQFLGERLQDAIINRFDGLAAERRNEIGESLLGLESTYKDVVKETNEATFVYILQQALLGLADDLMAEVQDVKDEYYQQKEKVEHENEVEAVEAKLENL